MRKERKDHNLFTMSGNCNITVEISELGGVGEGKTKLLLILFLLPALQDTQG
jgi:hypothetical protein